VLKVIAVSRLAAPDAKILVTTALETLDKQNGRKRGLLSGANSLMINVTPAKYRKQYTLYPGRPDRDRSIAKNIQTTLKLLYALGRAPTDLGVGHNL
jgi:biotin synthase